MKLLMENWRGFLLQEAMATPKDLPNGVGVRVKISPQRFEISYVASSNVNIYGAISILKPGNVKGAGPCLNACLVEETSETTKGFGPMLYEIAIELASAHFEGLTADRVVVSQDALNVWKKYSKRSDVDHKQLDTYVGGVFGDEKGFDKPQLTPEDPTDDCYMSSAHSEGNWTKSPLSKVYRKDSQDFIKKLKRFGKIEFVKLDKS